MRNRFIIPVKRYVYYVIDGAKLTAYGAVIACGYRRIGSNT